MGKLIAITLLLVCSAAAFAQSKPENQVVPDIKPKILHKENPKYTKEAREKKVSGVVTLSLLFAETGKIEEIKVVRGLPYGLTESAIESAKKIKFNPAQKDGKPVDYRSNVEFTFVAY